VREICDVAGRIARQNTENFLATQKTSDSKRLSNEDVLAEDSSSEITTVVDSRAIFQYFAESWPMFQQDFRSDPEGARAFVDANSVSCASSSLASSSSSALLRRQYSASRWRELKEGLTKHEAVCSNKITSPDLAVSFLLPCFSLRFIRSDLSVL